MFKGRSGFPSFVVWNPSGFLRIRRHFSGCFRIHQDSQGFIRVAKDPEGFFSALFLKNPSDSERLFQIPQGPSELLRYPRVMLEEPPGLLRILQAS